MEESRQEDLRVRRTRRLLLETLNEMLRKKTFDQIHVKDICARAGIHRSTFYHHFEDKYHLLTFVIRELMTILIGEMTEGSQARTVDQTVQRIFKHFLRHRDSYHLILLDRRDAEVRQIYQEEFTRAMAEQVGEAAGLPPDTVMVRCQMFTGGLLSVVAWWLSQKERPSPERMAALYLAAWDAGDRFPLSAIGPA